MQLSSASRDGSHSRSYSTTVRDLGQLLDGEFGREVGERIGERLAQSRDRKAVEDAIETARRNPSWSFSAGIMPHVLRLAKGKAPQPRVDRARDYDRREFGLPILMEVIGDDTISAFSGAAGSRLGMAYKIFSESDMGMMLRVMRENPHMQNGRVEGEFLKKLSAHSFASLQGRAQVAVLEYAVERLDQPPGKTRHLDGVKAALRRRIGSFGDEAMGWLCERASEGRRSETLESLWRGATEEFMHLTAQRKEMIVKAVESNPDSIYSSIAGTELRRIDWMDDETKERLAKLADRNRESLFYRTFAGDDASALTGLARGELQRPVQLGASGSRML